jgi:hypothetical protein
MLEAQSPPSKSALDPYGAFVSRRPAGGTKLGLGEAAQRALAGTPRPEVMEASAYEVEEARQACLACLEECDVLLAPTLFILPPTPTTRYIVIDGHRWPLRQVLLSGTCFGNVVGAPALKRAVCRSFQFAADRTPRGGWVAIVNRFRDAACRRRVDEIAT